MTDPQTLGIKVPLEAHGFGAVLAVHYNRLASPAPIRLMLEGLLESQRALVASPLSKHSSAWRPLRQERVPSAFPPPPAHRQPPSGAVEVPGTPSYLYISRGTEIDGSWAPWGSSGVDAMYEWEEAPQLNHERNMSIDAFYADIAPVSNAQYAAFLKKWKYRPDDERNFLREWPDYKVGLYPINGANVPVTGISLVEAEAFCSAAGGRLPTAAEWQYAAQGGDAQRQYPWGDELGAEGEHLPVPRQGRVSPPPEPSDMYSNVSASPFGLVDLVGNVWQYTADKFQDEHTRFVLLKGGSSYQLTNTSMWYFPTANAIKLNRHSKYFLFDDAYERAATIGFRCVYDKDMNKEEWVGVHGDGKGLHWGGVLHLPWWASASFIILGFGWFGFGHLGISPIDICRRHYSRVSGVIGEYAPDLPGMEAPIGFCRSQYSRLFGVVGRSFRIVKRTSRWKKMPAGFSTFTHGGGAGGESSGREGRQAIFTASDDHMEMGRVVL